MWPGSEPGHHLSSVFPWVDNLLQEFMGPFDFFGRELWEACTSHAFSFAAFILYHLAMALSVIIWITLDSLARSLYRSTLTHLFDT